MRARTCGTNLKAIMTPLTPRPPIPNTQNQCSPAMKNSAAQTRQISIVCPKSGCRSSGTIVIGRQRHRQQITGQLAPALRAFGERPGHEDDERRLQEFRGLNAENPTLRTLHLVPEYQAPR